MIIINASKIEEQLSLANASVDEDESQIYELTRDAQIFGKNEVAKFEMASELRHQGVTIEAISRILSIPQEDLLTEFDS